MTTTGLLQSLISLQPLQQLQDNQLVETSDWEPQMAWRFDPTQHQEGEWYVAIAFHVSVDPGTVGALRIRTSDGALSVPAPLGVTAVDGFLGWVRVSSTVQTVHLDAKRGSGGFRINKAGALGMTIPPVELRGGPYLPASYSYGLQWQASEGTEDLTTGWLDTTGQYYSAAPGNLIGHLGAPAIQINNTQDVAYTGDLAGAEPAGRYRFDADVSTLPPNPPPPAGAVLMSTRNPGGDQARIVFQSATTAVLEVGGVTSSVFPLDLTDRTVVSLQRDGDLFTVEAGGAVLAEIDTPGVPPAAEFKINDVSGGAGSDLAVFGMAIPDGLGTPAPDVDAEVDPPTPPPAPQCLMLSVNGVESLYGDPFVPVPNPNPGSGTSRLFIASMPGPGYNATGATGLQAPVDPLDPTGIVPVPGGQSETNPNFPYQVQYRMWWQREATATTDFVFGYDTNNSNQAVGVDQSRAVIAFNYASNAITSTDALFGNDLDGFPSLSAPANTQLLPVVFNQSQPVVISGPGTEVINNTATSPRRGLAVYSQGVVSAGNIQPGSVTYQQVDDGRLHAVVVVGCGDVSTPGVSAFQTIDPADLTFDLFADDINTFGRNRDDKQLVQSGAGHNPPSQTSNEFFTSSFGTGYTMVWNAAGDEVTIQGGNAGPTGEIRRMWREPMNGLMTLRGQMTYDPAVSNYGTYQSPQNLDTPWPGTPGFDRLFVDGSRALHFSDIDGYFRVGPGADEVIFGVVFPTDRWMVGPAGTTGAMNNSTGPLDMHAPPERPISSMFYLNVREGVVEMVHRSASSGLVDISPAGNLNGQLDNGGSLGSIPLNPLGQWNALVLSLKIDPTSSDRFIRVWTVNPLTGAMTQVLNDTQQRGYYFTGTAPDGQTAAQANAQCYAIHQHYVFHVATSTADAAAGVQENWDVNTGRVGPDPTMRLVGVRRCSGGINPSFTVADMGDHLANAMGL